MLKIRAILVCQIQQTLTAVEYIRLDHPIQLRQPIPPRRSHYYLNRQNMS